MKLYEKKFPIYENCMIRDFKSTRENEQQRKS